MFASGGALAGLVTLLGASCCVLPLLAQIGLGTAFVAQLSFLVRARPYLLMATLALIVAAIVACFWNGRRPRPVVLTMLVAAGALVAASLELPKHEAQIMQWIGSP